MSNQHSRLPWRIDEDNDKRIVVMSDDGNLVLIMNYSDIPPEAEIIRDEIIARTRADYYMIVDRVNQQAAVLANYL